MWCVAGHMAKDLNTRTKRAKSAKGDLCLLLAASVVWLSLQALVLLAAHLRKGEAEALLQNGRYENTRVCGQETDTHAHLDEARKSKPEIVVHNKLAATSTLGLL
jgi:hypothetical protein